MIYIVKPGGWLYKEKWDGEGGSYVQFPVTSYHPTFWPCELAPGVVLGDIFKLMSNQLALWDTLLPCEDFIREGLRKPSKPADLDYLELYWQFDIEDDEVTGNYIPWFHGYKNGEPYALDFLAANKLVDIPLKLGGMYITEKPIKFAKAQFTLTQIITGIFWELSFYGPPEERDAKSRQLFEKIDESSSYQN